MISHNACVRIERAKPADVPLIVGFVTALAAYENMSQQVRVDEPRLREMMFGKKHGLEGILAYLDDRPAGCALFFHNFPTFSGRRGLYIEDLFVEPVARGRGIGQAMLAHLARLAIERDCCRLEWWVLDWNKQALDFYAGLGAKPRSDYLTHHLSGQALERLSELDPSG